MAPARRDLLIDVAITAVLVVVSLFGTGPAAANQDRTAPVGAYVLAVAAALAMLAWHFRPLWTFIAVGGAAVSYLAAGYPYGPIMVTLVLAVYGLCVRSDVRRSLTFASALLGVAMVAVGIAVAVGTRDWTEFASVAAWIVVPSALGVTIRVRRDAAAAVRSEQARRAVSEERLRLAQEVHDVAGHGFAVIAMQAGVGLRVLDRDPAGARAALEAIRAASTEALDGLRAEIQELRRGADTPRLEPGEEPAPTPLRPRTGLRDLPALAARMRAGGLPVTVESSLDESGLPEELDHAAYRIVQEALTNVLRHAGPAATAAVHVGRNGEVLEVAVMDSGHGPTGPWSEGTGIDGMRDRARALGGSLIAGPVPGGGFAVRARLPLAPQPAGDGS